MVPKLDGVDHIHVYVQNRPAAEQWYARVLGFGRVEALAGWSDGQGPLTLQDADGQVHLALFERAPQPNRSVIALRVGAAAFKGWQAHLAQQPGLAVTFADHEIAHSIYFSDPDGNPYEITTYEVGARTDDSAGTDVAVDGAAWGKA